MVSLQAGHGSTPRRWHSRLTGLGRTFWKRKTIMTSISGVSSSSNTELARMLQELAKKRAEEAGQSYGVASQSLAAADAGSTQAASDFEAALLAAGLRSKGLRVLAISMK
jgi:hypothetical protein